MARTILSMFVLMLCTTNAAQAIQCFALPDISIRGNWSWQRIDGRFCWYIGDRNAPKESLRWTVPTEPAKQVALRPAQKIQCRSQAEGPGRWAWRLIDGKQCWFLGARETPKEQLQWPADERVEPPRLVEIAPEREPDPPEAEPASLEPWQLVNQKSNGDLVFAVQGPWIASPMSFDFNVGAEFLTHVPMTLWPLLVKTVPMYAANQR
ncbi:MAG: hypothetical protein WD871_01275 [Xanthobacteraceae bacterium]